MKILGIKWFTNMRGSVGVVLYEDSSGKERAGISAVSGIDEEADTHLIVKYGLKFSVNAAKELMRTKIPKGNSPQVEKQIKDKIKDVTADMEPGETLRMQIDIDKERDE